jgi:hypothetical protein
MRYHFNSKYTGERLVVAALLQPLSWVQFPAPGHALMHKGLDIAGQASEERKDPGSKSDAEMQIRVISDEAVIPLHGRAGGKPDFSGKRAPTKHHGLALERKTEWINQKK